MLINWLKKLVYKEDKNNLFSFPDHFYSSLHCSRENFDKVWNSIPDDKKKNINMRQAIEMVCIKLSDDAFYNDSTLNEDCLIASEDENDNEQSEEVKTVIEFMKKVFSLSQ